MASESKEVMGIARAAGGASIATVAAAATAATTTRAAVPPPSFKSILRELEQELGTMDLLCSNSEGVLEDATEASRLARAKQVVSK